MPSTRTDRALAANSLADEGGGVSGQGVG